MRNLLALACCILACYLNAQDLLLKTNGDTLIVKVVEVGTNAVSFKKFNYLDGPVFVENRENIFLIRFHNGDVQQFNTKAPVTVKSDTLRKNNTGANNSNPTDNSSVKQEEKKNKIERLENKYYINGNKANQKDVNRMLASAKNPAIPLALKGAKGMKTAQTILKITSYPTTIVGGPLSLLKVIDLWNDVQRGRTTSKSYTNAIFSVLPTMAFPITTKILKKKSDKMYDKIIDMYNTTN